MNLLNSALELAKKNLPVFPLVPRTKVPAIPDFENAATTDLEMIEAWWRRNPSFNIGISTGKFITVDVDNKKEKKGSEELERLKAQGKTFPETFEQRTPTGGIHLIYKSEGHFANGVDVLGPGLDIRGKGGYVVGAGSVLENGIYTAIQRPIVSAPDWLVLTCKKSKLKEPIDPKMLEALDPKRSQIRALNYLSTDAPIAIEGQGGDLTTYRVACELKDRGIDQDTCFHLLCEHWNDRCLPPWSASDLKKKIDSAYRYGRDPVGVSAPETQFSKIDEKVLTPIDKLNAEYAYLGGSKGIVLWETKDEEGRFLVDHIPVSTFHQNLAARKLNYGEKPVALSRIWLSSPDRRTYDRICFLPGKKAPSNYYNIWKGYAVKPLTESDVPSARSQAAYKAFTEHAFENVCNRDQKLFLWLMGYFAHLVQRPWEKPLVALVMKGRKGVGKNALIERIGYLLGECFAVVSNRRHLTGNFNSLLENKLLLVLDEAFWSGDKAAEGVLKDLITGEKHLIERKGEEPYRVRNCLRVAILGNENWLAPASEDERRYAVFNVGEEKKQNRAFFKEMREGMEAGGYALLLRELLRFDLSAVDVTNAPSTLALLEQKEASLSIFYQWWKDCLTEGQLLGTGFDGWPGDVSKERFRKAFYEYCKDRGTARYLDGPEKITKDLRRCLPELNSVQKREEGGRVRTYLMPDLKTARAAWNKFIGHETQWEDEGDLFS